MQSTVTDIETANKPQYTFAIQFCAFKFPGLNRLEQRKRSFKKWLPKPGYGIIGRDLCADVTT